MSLRDSLEAVRVPLAMVFGSRLVLFWIAYLGLVWMNVRHPYAASHFPQNLFLDGWFNWDAQWYRSIIVNGYTNVANSGQRDTVFMPLYPLTVRAVSMLTGDIFTAGLLVSNLSLAAATVFLYRFVKERYDEGLAQKTCVLLLLYPFSFYFSGLYTESLFFLGNMGAFYFAHRKQWLISGLFLAAASATRTVGIVTTLAVALFYLSELNWDLKKVRPNILFIGLGALGIGSYMVFLKLKFGDPFLFVTSLDAPGWGKEMTATRFWEVFMSGFRSNWLAGQVTLQILFAVWGLIITAVLILLGARRMGLVFTVWSVLVWLVYFRVWTGSGRFFSVHFPLFILVAQLLEKRPMTLAFLLFASGATLVMLTFVHSHGFPVS